MTSALAAGADDVVEKSRDIAVIKARLRALLRRKLIYAENRRISEEFRGKELEILRARAEKEAAEARAALAGQLEKANRELKEAQAQLVQSAKMASLGQLVAGVAHEINNPLAYVMNHQATVDRALESLAGPVESHLSEAELGKWRKARQRLGEMQEGLERIKDLVLKLRTFSRLDEGELKYVRIEESIESVLTLLQYRLKDRIRINRRYGEPKVVPCYPGPLNQVLMNVLANAIDAIEGKGEITITTGESDSMFFISVADTGKGIPEAVRERIFEPFYTTKPVGEGTGLGLSISYGIVKRHRGMLEVRSVEGRGTEMIVRIPLHLERREGTGDRAKHE
jgi:two-component system NtrC family sensor kinase